MLGEREKVGLAGPRRRKSRCRERGVALWNEKDVTTT